jgi:hypothetical protein
MGRHRRFDEALALHRRVPVVDGHAAFGSQAGGPLLRRRPLQRAKNCWDISYVAVVVCQLSQLRPGGARWGELVA